MEGKKILEAVTEKEKEKKELDNKKQENKKRRAMIKEQFLKCKDECQCKGKCSASGYKQCPICGDVLKSVCAKQSCRDDGNKPRMIEISKSTSRRRLINSEEESSDDSSQSDIDFDQYASDEDPYASCEEMNQITSPPNSDLIEVPIGEVELNQWVKVMYEDEVFIGKVIKKRERAVRVRCLTHPFGIAIPQDLEREGDAVDYTTVYQCNVLPKWVADGRSYKYTYSL